MKIMKSGENISNNEKWRKSAAYQGRRRSVAKMNEKAWTSAWRKIMAMKNIIKIVTFSICAVRARAALARSCIARAFAHLARCARSTRRCAGVMAWHQRHHRKWRREEISANNDVKIIKRNQYQRQHRRKSRWRKKMK
jgi:hypothetical protein